MIYFYKYVRTSSDLSLIYFLVLGVLGAQLCLTLCDPVDYIACQAPLSMGFSRQEYWSELSFPPLGDLPDPGIEPISPVSPALAGGFFTTEPSGKSLYNE